MAGGGGYSPLSHPPKSATDLQITSKYSFRGSWDLNRKNQVDITQKIKEYVVYDKGSFDYSVLIYLYVHAY